MLQICQKRYHVKHDNIQSELVACAACHSTAKETLMTEVNNHPVKNKGSWSGSCWLITEALLVCFVNDWLQRSPPRSPSVIQRSMPLALSSAPWTAPHFHWWLGWDESRSGFRCSEPSISLTRLSQSSIYCRWLWGKVVLKTDDDLRSSTNPARYKINKDYSELWIMQSCSGRVAYKLRA